MRRIQVFVHEVELMVDWEHLKLNVMVESKMLQLVLSEEVH